jgi:hypothetical protein
MKKSDVASKGYRARSAGVTARPLHSGGVAEGNQRDAASSAVMGAELSGRGALCLMSVQDGIIRFNLKGHSYYAKAC